MHGFPEASFNSELTKAASLGQEFKSVALKPKFTFLFPPTTRLSLNSQGKALRRTVWVEKQQMDFKALLTNRTDRS